MDDEIAMATLLERTANWVRGEGREPYPLAEGAQDQQTRAGHRGVGRDRQHRDYLSRSMELSVEAPGPMRRSGSTCSTSPQPVGQSSTVSSGRTRSLVRLPQSCPLPKSTN